MRYSKLEEYAIKSIAIKLSHFLKEHMKDGIFISCITMICGQVIGALIGLSFDAPRPEDLIITDPPPQEWIFQNNSSVALGLSLGGLLFGVITIAILLFNSILLGYWVQERIRSQGPMMAFLLVVPHGIFEIPALLLAGAVGVEIAKWTFRLFISSPSSEGEQMDKEENSDEVLIKWVVSRMIVVEVLLCIASYVEAYIIPLLVGMHM